MVAVAVGTVWLGYTLGIWGVCLVKGCNVTFTDLFHQTWPGTTGTTGPGAGSKGSNSVSGSTQHAVTGT